MLVYLGESMRQRASGVVIAESCGKIREAVFRRVTYGRGLRIQTVAYRVLPCMDIGLAATTDQYELLSNFGCEACSIKKRFGPSRLLRLTYRSAVPLAISQVEHRIPLTPGR